MSGTGTRLVRTPGYARCRCKDRIIILRCNRDRRAPRATAVPGTRGEERLIVALNIKNEEAERLAGEVAEMAGESKTEAVRRALAERRSRLQAAAGGAPAARLRRFLEEELWPAVPEEVRGRTISRAEEDAILGYGPEGV